MIRLALILAASCAAPLAVADASIADPDQVCRPAPTIAGVEWSDCDGFDGVRHCRYFVGNCRIVLTRRDADCESAWFELSRECRQPVLRVPGERGM